MKELKGALHGVACLVVGAQQQKTQTNLVLFYSIAVVS